MKLLQSINDTARTSCENLTLSIENSYFIGRFASLHTPVYGYYVTISYNKVWGSTSLAD